jgi:hypothetical protein
MSELRMLEFGGAIMNYRLRLLRACSRYRNCTAVTGGVGDNSWH